MIRRTRIGVLLALGLVSAAQGALLSMVPLLMEALAIDAGRLGVAVGAGLLATAALAPVAGALADRLGPDVTARGGLAMICAASALLFGYTALVVDGAVGTAAAFAVVLATRLSNGIGVAVLHPSAQAWLWAEATDEQGTTLQNWASAVQNAGRIAGPVGVALIGDLGAAWTLAALAAISASALLLLTFTPGPAAEAAHVVRQPGEPPHDLPRRDTWPLLAALLSLHLLAGGAQFLLGPLLVARLDLGAPEAARWAGWLTALAAAATIAGNVLTHRLRMRQRALAGAGLAMAGALSLAPFANVESVAAGVAVIAFGIGAAVPSALAELMRRSPPQARGRTAGRASAAQAAAYAAAAPACGFLFSASPVLAAALLPLPAAAACLILVAASRVRQRL